MLHAALAAGLHQAGARVFSLGMCGTEEIYDAAARQDFDAGATYLSLMRQNVAALKEGLA